MNTGIDDNDKIRLLIVVPSLQCGGSEKHATVLCNNIDTQKFLVTLVVLNNENPFYNIHNKAITVINLKVKQVRYAAFKLRMVIKKIQPDIIYTNANHLNLFFALFKKFMAKKIKVVARESSVVSSNSKRAKFPVLYNRLLKKYYKRLNYFICQSGYMQQDLIDNYDISKEKTVVINNPAEESVAAVNASSQIKLLTVARLSEEKGIDRLIRSVAKLTIPFTYHIIGDGDQQQALQQLISSLHLEDKVFLEGEKNNPFEGMEDATLFLMGSYYEGFPNTLLEAGALGIPAVAYDAPGGINEIINNGETGFVVKGNDAAAFKLAIEEAIHTNFNRISIQQMVLQKFPLNPIIRAAENLFVQLYKQKTGTLPEQNNF